VRAIWDTDGVFVPHSARQRIAAFAAEFVCELGHSRAHDRARQLHVALEAVADDEAWEAISSDPAEQKRTLLAAIEADRASLSAFANSSVQLREDQAADAAMVASIPPAEALDRLVRYEAHLERLLARALDQLFRSQRARSAAARDNVVEFDARKGSA
jgi:hypothetical protein